MNLRREYRLGAILSYVNIVLNIVIGLLMAPMIIQALGRPQYALYNMIGKYASYLMVLDFGLGAAVIRYVAKYRAEGDEQGMERFLGMIVMLYAAIGVLIAIAGTVGYFNLDRLYPNLTADELAMAQKLFIIVITNVSFSMLSQVLPSVLAGSEHFIIIRVVNLLRQLSRPLILFLMIRRGTDAVQVVLLDTALNVLAIAAHAVVVFGRMKVRIRFAGFDKPLLKEIAHYSVFIFLNVVMSELYWNVDVQIVGSRVLTAAVITATSGQFVSYFMDLSSALTSMLMARAMQIVAQGSDRRELTNLMIRIGRLQWMLLGLILIGFVLCGQSFLMLWVGEALGAADVTTCYAIVVMLMLTLMIPLIQNTAITIVQAMNRHAFRSVILVLIALLNVLLTVWLVKIWGPFGAAAGTAASLIVGNIAIMNWYYDRKIGLEIPRFFKEALHGTLPATLLAAALSCLTLLLPQGSWLWLLVRIGCISVIYLGCMWWLGMNVDEKNLVRGLLHRARPEQT